MEQLLTLFNRFSKLVKEAFQDDPRFLTARDKVSLKLSWQSSISLSVFVLETNVYHLSHKVIEHLNNIMNSKIWFELQFLICDTIVNISFLLNL